MSEEFELPLVQSNGITYLEVDDWLMAFVIPSRKRMERLAKHPLLPVSNVLVHESEFDAYQDALKDLDHGSLITHDVQGLGRIMNHMIATCFAEKRCRCVLRTDDDFRGFFWMMSRVTNGKVTKLNDLLAIATQHARCCIDAGIGVFGTNVSATPMGRQAMQPFQLRGWVTARYIGICDPRIGVHEGIVTMDDVDMSLRSMELSGMIWIDQRYHSIHESPPTGLGKGGLADVRSSMVYDNDLRLMEEYWPGVVEPLWGQHIPSGLTRHKLHLR